MHVTGLTIAEQPSTAPDCVADSDSGSAMVCATFIIYSADTVNPVVTLEVGLLCNSLLNTSNFCAMQVLPMQMLLRLTIGSNHAGVNLHAVQEHLLCLFQVPVLHKRQPSPGGLVNTAPLPQPIQDIVL